MLDFPFSFLYRVLRDFWNWIYLRIWPRAALSPADKLKRLKEHKPVLEKLLYRNFREGLRQDVVIRDVRRADAYPDTSDQPGISPWFRVGLVGLYHRGILVGLRWHSLKKMSDGHVRLTDYKNQEEGDLKVLLCGRIPFEAIEIIDEGGDEYYSFPHIYCHFFFRGEPYEDIGFYKKGRLFEDGPSHYTLVASYRDVRDATKRAGINPLI